MTLRRNQMRNGKNRKDADQRPSPLHGSLPEMISPYMKQLIEKTGGVDGPIGRQFIQQPNTEQPTSNDRIDPLIEGEHEVAPGMIYKYRGALSKNGDVQYHGRVLWTVSRFCATYCRFCTRGRLVGLPAGADYEQGETLATKPYLSYEDIEACVRFLESMPEINEVILSGGDPFISPPQYLQHIFQVLQTLQEAGTIDFVRIHTRAPITNPYAIKPHHFAALGMVKMPHMVLHINHPAELSEEVRTYISTVKQQTDTQLFSQSVLLKGVNDSVEILYKLFYELAKLGVRPYYLHYNDPVYWAESFTVPFAQAVEIWQVLRTRMSGILSTAKFVIDTPYGTGKVPVPEAFWEPDQRHYYDFLGERHHVIETPQTDQEKIYSL
ncbi:MAG: KamA family radical SAM protein [Patescibacteria group bacterium]